MAHDDAKCAERIHNGKNELKVEWTCLVVFGSPIVVEIVVS